jgi:hypothetical protein
MNVLWSYFWPVFAAGLVIGAIAGLIAWRKRSGRRTALAAGCLLSIACAGLWHGPLGGADRFASEVERVAQIVLVNYEAPAGVTARIHHGPLMRQLILSGPANDFQRREAVRLLSQIPGVSQAAWGPTGGIPLIAESAIVSVLGFLLGLLLAYLVELRRRYNAQWKW